MVITSPHSELMLDQILLYYLVVLNISNRPFMIIEI